MVKITIRPTVQVGDPVEREVTAPALVLTAEQAVALGFVGRGWPRGAERNRGTLAPSYSGADADMANYEIGARGLCSCVSSDAVRRLIEAGLNATDNLSLRRPSEKVAQPAPVSSDQPAEPGNSKPAGPEPSPSSCPRKRRSVF